MFLGMLILIEEIFVLKISGLNILGAIMLLEILYILFVGSLMCMLFLTFWPGLDLFFSICKPLGWGVLDKEIQDIELHINKMELHE